MRLHFFPALLPLASVLPALLTALGFVAAFVHRQSRRFGRASSRLWLSLAVIFLVLAGGIFIRSRMNRPSESAGTQLTSRARLPVVEKAAAPAASASSSSSIGDTRDFFPEAWSQLLNHHPLSGATVAGDTLLVGTYEGTLDAFSRADGHALWSMKKTEPILSAPVISNGVAYVGEGLHTSPNSALTAIALAGGSGGDARVLWQREFLGHLEMSPRVDESSRTLWVGAGPLGLWALDTKDGGVRWRARIGHVDSVPLLLGDSLYVPAQPDPAKNESLLHRLNPSDGSSRWQARIPGQPFGTPIASADGKSVFLTTAIGQLGPHRESDQGWSHGISSDDGKIHWTVKLPGMPIYASTYLAAKDLVFHTLKEGAVVALSASSGELKWKADLHFDVHAPATLIADRDPPLLAVVDLKGVMHCLDALTGKPVATLAMPPETISPPLYLDHRLYVASPGLLSAFEVPSGGDVR